MWSRNSALTCWLVRLLRSMASEVSRSTSVSSSTADRATADSATTTRISRTRRTRSDIRIVRAAASSGARPVRAVFLQFVEQGLLADPQDFSRAGLVVLGVVQGQLDQRALGLLDGLANPDAQLSLFGGKAAGSRHRTGKARRQMRHLDASFPGQNHGALQHVTQLAYVSRPVAGLEARQNVSGKLGYLGRVLAVELFEQRLRQYGQIVLALAQRRQRDGENVQPVVQIFAEFTFSDGAVQRRIRGRDHTHVQLYLALPSQTAHAAVLQHAQELG